jgi:uncharacterized protein with HEPN domain
MDRKIKSYLFDIRTSTDDIQEFFAGREIGLDSLLDEKKTLTEGESNRNITGEATKRSLKSFTSFSISNAKEMVGARNFIAPKYGSISYEIIVTILTTHQPFLRNERKGLLKK